VCFIVIWFYAQSRSTWLVLNPFIELAQAENHIFLRFFKGLAALAILLTGSVGISPASSGSVSVPCDFGNCPVSA
jgi:hypothetical protein